MSRRKQSRPFRVQEDNDNGSNSACNGTADISMNLTLETCSNLNKTQLISSNNKLLIQTSNTINSSYNENSILNEKLQCNKDYLKTQCFQGIKDTNDVLYKENGYSTSSCSEDNSSLPEHRFNCECEESFTEEEDYQEHREICDVQKQTLLDDLNRKSEEIKVKNEFIDEINDDTENNNNNKNNNNNNSNKIEDITLNNKQMDVIAEAPIIVPTVSDSNPNIPFVPGHVTFEELQNTKVAVAQYAASLLANNADNETAIKDLALLQSTLFALQNQQVFQMQMMQQFHKKLSLGQISKEIDELSDDEFNDGDDKSIENENKIEENDKSDVEINETEEKNKTIDIKSNKNINISNLENNKERNPLDYSAGHVTNPEKNIHVEKENPVTKYSESMSKYLMPDQSDEKKCTSSTLNQLANTVESSINYHNSSMSDVITNHDTPPSLDGPNSLEMLQKHAQDVLDSASQGLLSGNLADELAFSKDKMSLYDEKGNRNESFFKHRCRYCGKVFGSDSALQIHIRSHTGERPFKCNICGSRFTTKGNLKVHFQRHTARFPHIQMNPHPVPEHLDKYHPPLLDQMSPEQDEYSNYPQPCNGNLSVPFLRPPGVSNLPVYAPSIDTLIGESQAMFNSKSNSDEQNVPADLSKPQRIAIVHLKPDKEISEIIPKNIYNEEKKDKKFEECITIASNDDSNDSVCSQKLNETRKDETEISSTIIDSSMESKCNGIAQDLRCESENKIALNLSESRIRISRSPSVLSETKKEIESRILPPVLESKKTSAENTGTSETSKLQELVNSIENNLTNPNECVVCHRILSCKKALHTHYLTHTGEKPFLCPICGRTFTTKGNLKTHIGIHNLQFPMRSSHQCPVCHKQYLNSQVLQQHIKTHTGDKLEITEEEIHAAEIRDFPIMSPEAYSRMMSLYDSRNHLEKKQSSFGSNSSITDDEFVEDDENLTEPSLSLVAIKNEVRAINTIKLQSRKYDEYHENKSHDTLKQFKADKIKSAITTSVNLTCASNDETSSSQTESSEGALDLTPRTNAAKVLNNTFPITSSSYTKTLPFMNNNFSSHQMISNSPFNFLSISGVRGNTTCKICFKTFACYSALDTHYRSHTKEKPFKCKVCDRGFSTKGNMKQHMLTHNMSNHITESVNSNSNSSDGGNADYQSSEMSTTMHDYPDVIHPMNLSNSNNLNKFATVNECKNFNKEFNHLDGDTAASFLPNLEKFNTKFFNADQNKHIKQEIPGVKRTHSEIDQPLAKRQSFSGFDIERTPEKNTNTTLVDLKKNDRIHNSDNEEVDDLQRNTLSPLKIIKPESSPELFEANGKDKEKMLKEFTDNSPLAQLSQYEEQHYQKQQLQQQQQQQQQMQLHQQAVNELPNTKHLCVVCRKNFSSSSALQIHMRTHTGDKPFKCSVCRKAFTTKGNLKVHMGTHMWTNTTSHRGRRMSLELPLNRPHPMNSQDSELLQRRPDLFYPYLPSPFLNGMHQKISDMHMLQQAGHGLPGLLPPQDINMTHSYAGLFGFAGLMPNQVLPYSPSPSPVSTDKQLNSPKISNSNNTSDLVESPKSPGSPAKGSDVAKPQPIPRIQRQWDMQYEHNDNKTSKIENGVEGKTLLKPFIRSDGLSI